MKKVLKDNVRSKVRVCTRLGLRVNIASMLAKHFSSNIRSAAFTRALRPARPSGRQQRKTMAPAATDKIVFWDILPAPGGCPYAQRAWIAFEELGVPYEHKLADVSDKPKEFTNLYKSIVKSNDSAKVPTIIDGDFKITESLVVVDYLDAKYGKGNGLTPSDPQQAAEVKLFVELFTSKFQGPFFKALRSESDEQLTEALKALEYGLEVLDDFTRSSGRDEKPGYFLGSRYSLAETHTTPFLRRALVTLPYYKNVDVEQLAKDKGLTRLVQWFQASLDRESNKKTGPSDEDILKSFKKFVNADVSPGFKYKRSR